jgi:phytoene dehydrogenase-like protein
MVPAAPYEFKDRWGAEEGGRLGERYRSIKEKYAEVLVEAVSSAFPDLIRNVEAYHVSTPVTYEQLTMAMDGCWYDSACVPGQVGYRRPGPGTPIKGLYLTGSKSVLGGGIRSSIMAGALAADSILKGKLSSLFQ